MSDHSEVLHWASPENQASLPVPKSRKPRPTKRKPEAVIRAPGKYDSFPFSLTALAAVGWDSKAAVVLSRLAYWWPRRVNGNTFVKKSYSDWHSELGMTEREIDTINKVLVETGMVEITNVPWGRYESPSRSYTLTDKALFVLNLEEDPEEVALPQNVVMPPDSIPTKCGNNKGYLNPTKSTKKNIDTHIETGFAVSKKENSLGVLGKNNPKTFCSSEQEIPADAGKDALLTQGGYSASAEKGGSPGEIEKAAFFETGVKKEAASSVPKKKVKKAASKTIPKHHLGDARPKRTMLAQMGIDVPRLVEIAKQTGYLAQHRTDLSERDCGSLQRLEFECRRHRGFADDLDPLMGWIGFLLTRYSHVSSYVDENGKSSDLTGWEEFLDRYAGGKYPSSQQSHIRFQFMLKHFRNWLKEEYPLKKKAS